MEKNNLTFIWEERGGSNETKIALPGSYGETDVEGMDGADKEGQVPL